MSTSSDDVASAVGREIVQFAENPTGAALDIPVMTQNRGLVLVTVTTRAQRDAQPNG